MRQIGDVDAACRDIGRDEHANLVRLEGRQRTLTSGLALIAMNGHRADALLIQIGRESIRTVLGAGKNEHLRPIALMD